VQESHVQSEFNSRNGEKGRTQVREVQKHKLQKGRSYAGGDMLQVLHQSAGTNDGNDGLKLASVPIGMGSAILH
jgi:hypothetical protein